MRKLPVGYEVKKLARRIDRSMDAFVAKHSGGALTGMNGWILQFLFRRRESDVFQKDVEAAFRIRRSTATAFLQHMEAAGYIERIPVSYDARLKKIVLTQKAIALYEEMEEEVSRFEKRLTNGFSEEELAAFDSYIARFSENLKEEFRAEDEQKDR